MHKTCLNKASNMAWAKKDEKTQLSSAEEGKLYYSDKNSAVFIILFIILVCTAL